MPRTFRLFPAVVFLLILCLAPRAGAAAEPARFPASFVTAGLLLKPDETPEETLLRAHGRDARAITLVAVGYIFGIGGFPQEYELGSIWARQVYALGVENTILVSILHEQAVRRYGGPLSAESLGIMAVGCDMARKDPTAALFREAGIFDLQAFCTKVEARKKDLPGWKKSYSDELKNRRPLQKYTRERIRLARALRSRPATAEERDLLVKEEPIPQGVWLFFVATDHNPAGQTPNWSADRLLAFVEAQLPDPKSQEDSDAWVASSLAGDALVSGLAQDPGDAAKALDLIRRAHAGDPEAMRLMALRYRKGGLGFVRQTDLEWAWLRHAALEADDARSMLLLAVELLRNDRPDEAWAWASLVETARAPDERTKRLAGRLTTMIDAAYGEETVAKGRELALSYRDERKVREGRRAEAEKSRSTDSTDEKK